MSLRNPLRLGQGRRRSPALVPDGTEELFVQSRDGKRDHYWSLANALSYFGGGVGSASLVTEAGATRTLAAADAEKMHRFVGATGCNVTIPLNSSEAIPIGAKYPLRQSAGVSADGLVRVVPEGGVVLNLPTGIRPPRFMGAIATKDSDETTADYFTGAPIAIPWPGTDIYDTDAFHNPASNNSRLTIPAGLGIKKIVLSGVCTTSLAINNDFGLYTTQKNGSTYDQATFQLSSADVSGSFISFSSCNTVCTDSDYFEMMLQQGTDTSITVSSSSSHFACEVTGIDAQGTSAGIHTEFWIEKVATDEWDIGGMFM